MPKHQGTGVLVAFEGIDGAGKTTQAALLASVLEQAKELQRSSKEPTNGSWGMKIRQSASGERLDPHDELEAFLKDREEHIKNVIQPSLDDGRIVILDRYYHSTIAYQGARGFSIDYLHKLMEAHFLIPDAVFLLDIDPEISLPRIERRGDVPNVFERRDSLKEARKLFQALDDECMIKIDGSMSIDAVHNEILRRFIDGPLKQRRCAKSYGCDDPFHCTFRLTNTCAWVNSAEQIRRTLAVQ